MALIGLSLETLDQPFKTLSGGEQTKILLVAMFLRKNHFLLIDEPTNHLDLEGRKIVAQYLKNKQGFILVSHDRVFVDEAVDHILSINKTFIEIQKGNYSSWRLNKDRQDEFELLQNERLKKDISRLEKTAREKADWANKIEASKFGSKVPDRGYIGHKSAKMMKRAKNIERRQNNAIDEKVKLLKNIERAESISFNNINGIKNNLLYVKDLEITYDTTKIFKPISFEINKGECLWLKGLNGCGKSSIIKLLMGEDINYSGEFKIAKKVSYVCQDSSFLKGSLNDYIDKENIDGDKLRSNLYKIGVDRNSFDKNIENWSEGQKKKLLIAKSLCEQAELYIWDEPLNYIDIIARKQIENLIVLERPTMLIIEHDRGFMDKIATKVIDVEKINSKG